MKVGDQFSINNYGVVVREDPMYGYFLQSTESDVRYSLSGDPCVTYPTLKDLESAVYQAQLGYLSTHKIGLYQKFYLGGIHYTVFKTSEKHYFLNALGFLDNNAIFLQLGIQDKYSWCDRFTSSPSLPGSFPECQTLDDLRRVVKALLKELIGRMSEEDSSLKDSEAFNVTNKPSLLQVETKPKLIKL